MGLLSICSTNYDRTLISGDLNLHLDNASDAVTMGFLELLHSFEFTQHVVGPTHKHGHTLDLVISRGVNITMDSAIERPELSDHHLLCFNMTVPDLEKNNSEFTLKKRFFSTSAANEFSLHLGPHLSDNLSVNDMVQHFNLKLESALNIVAPMKTKKKQNTRVTPWVNEHTRSL